MLGINSLYIQLSFIFEDLPFKLETILTYIRNIFCVICRILLSLFKDCIMFIQCLNLEKCFAFYFDYSCTGRGTFQESNQISIIQDNFQIIFSSYQVLPGLYVCNFCVQSTYVGNTALTVCKSGLNFRKKCNFNS